MKHQQGCGLLGFLQKFVFKLSLILLILLSVSKDSSATHSMGADMTYQCLGNNTYRIRLSFYRDCFGIPAPNFVNIDIYSQICNIDTFAVLHPIPGTGVEITPLCPSDTSTCNGGSFTGIQEWVYEGIFTFPATCTDWQLSYELCCRNQAITTIDDPLGQEIFIFSNLNNTICNNSPTFSNKPVPFVCMGQQFCFNHGAFDPDGDSLAYDLITPLSYFGTPVYYYPPYSPYQPLNSVPAMTFDHHTGDFCITPQSLEVTVMAVLVSEYRNGVLIGQVERDIQVTVINCNNTLPTLTGINGTNNYSATICADAPYCFNVFSADPDAGQTVTLTWDHSIQPASFNSNGTAIPTGSFCWTPTQADAGGTPHCFTATVTDNACPFFGTQIYSYCFTVLNVHVDAGPDQFANCGSPVTLNATGSAAFGNVTYQWSTGANSQSINAGAGTYTVTATNGSCTASDAVTVSPLSGPVAAFSTNPVCIGTPVQFSDQSSIANGNINSWQWTFGDGGTSTQQSPSHQYANAGTYSVKLIVNANGSVCPDTIIQQVTVNPLPQSAFTFSNVCLGNPLTFVNTSSPSGLTSSWNLGNNTSSNSFSPSVTYANSGSYTVSLTSTDAAGCSSTVQQAVNVFALPVASFSTSIPNPCPGDHVFFTDNSQTAISSWSWTFSNGTTSALQNPDVIFSPGNYSASLVVTDNNGCTATNSQNGNIITPPTAGITPPQSICPGGQVTITATGGNSYLWNDGSTTSSISVSPSSSGVYSVIATDANGCTATALTNVTIYSSPQVNAGNDISVCGGGQVTLTANGAQNYVWSNGASNQTITVTANTSTNYTVTGTDANGCTASDAVAITINANLTVTIPDQLICPGQAATLDAGYPGASYAWSNGQTTQTINVSHAGAYNVLVTDQNGCTGTAMSTITMGGQGLVPNPTTAGTCDGHWVSLDAGNPGNHYLWSTGATTQTIPVLNAGNYQVTVTDNDGCSISYVSTLIVNPNPTVAYQHPNICAGDTVQFTSITSVSSGNIAHYLWYFGDTHSSIAANPTHAYALPGNFSLKLTVTTDSGCIANFTAMDTVYAVPNAAVITPPVCLGTATLFIDQSGVPNDNIASWNWSFGDGSVSTMSSPSHTYTNQGTFQISLIVTSDHGCVDTAMTSAIVHPIPGANAGNDSSVCSGNDILLGSQAQSNVTYSWAPAIDLSDPNLAQPTFHGYNNTTTRHDETYHVITTNQFGCQNFDDVLVGVLPVPELNFSAPEAQCFEGNSFDFHAIGIIDANSTLQWDFTTHANPPTSTSTSPSNIKYSISGTIPVVLYYSYGQCPGIPVVDSVTVWQTPETGFLPTAYEGCMPLTVDFYNAHPANNNTYSWSIDGNAINDVHAHWTFDKEGTFRVTLNVTSENGCKAEPFSIPIMVYPLPTASFTNTPDHGTIGESLIEFLNYSTGASQYRWDFGDGTTDDFFNGNHIYSDTGSFDITLTVMSVHGCLDTVYGKVRIEDGFSFYVPNAFTPDDDGVNDTFQGYGTYIKTYNMWIYDRWGKIIYFTDQYNKPWNGRMHSIVQNDTYVYRIVLTDTHDKEHIYLGSVSLVK